MGALFASRRRWQGKIGLFDYREAVLRAKAKLILD